MPKFEQDVFKDGKLYEKVTLEVDSEGSTLTVLSAKDGSRVVMSFPQPTADVIYELLTLARPTKDGGELY